MKSKSKKIIFSKVEHANLLENKHICFGKVRVGTIKLHFYLSTKTLNCRKSFNNFLNLTAK